MPAIRRLVAILLGSSFIRFSIVGTLTLFVDMGVVQALVLTDTLDPRWARLPSFLVAATFAWALNRSFTFKAAHLGSPLAQWMRYVSANAIGMAVNLATYYALIWLFPLVYRLPFIGVAAGAVVGLAFNFTASKKLVFAAPKEPRG
jgi:putative flippase GtrA